MRAFRCKCGDCRTVCCQGWRITLSEPEYVRMMHMDCAEELKSDLVRAFQVFDEPSYDRYAYTVHGEDGRCPILDKGGLCRLHSQCGESMQPAVCRLFPRAIHPGLLTEAVCSGACEGVIEMLMECEAPLQFVTTEYETKSAPPEAGMDNHALYRRRSCMALWQTTGVPLSERLEGIAHFLGVKDPLRARDRLSLGRRLLTELGERSASLHPYARQALASAALSDDLPYEIACTQAEERMPLLMRHLENIVANHMYYVRFPYIGEGIPPTEAWMGLYGLYAMLEPLAVWAVLEGGTDTAFADTMAAAFRCAEHTDFYHNAYIVLRGTPSQAQ